MAEGSILNIPENKEALPSLSSAHGLLSWVASVDHKQIGIMYLFLAFLFFIVGGTEALLIRLQLAWPENEFIDPQSFNRLFTMHGTTMIFFVLAPGLFGLATYLIPLMIGANEMAFPRLNAMGLWMTLFGGLILNFSFLHGGAPDTGWFSYVPLSEKNYSYVAGVDYYCLGLLIAGIGTIAATLNFVVTILTLRIKGMALKILPVFVWMMLIDSFLILAAFPLLNAGLSMLLIDRQLNAHFFLANSGGSAILWQHLFWGFGHPEVYILILPAFGIMSEVVPVFSRKPIFGYAFLVGSGIAIALLSFGVWAHHMFAAGLGTLFNSFFSIASLLIAVPTGVKVISWICTMYGGSIHFKVAMLFAIAFIIHFTIGGLTGVSFAIAPLDWQLTDTYYVVAHLHYVFLGGSLFCLFSGVYYWFPKMTGKMLNEKIGKWHFWLFLIGFNFTFMPQHFLGIMGMPRRVYTYPDLPYYGSLNFLSTSGAYMMGIAIAIFLYNIFKSIKNGAEANENPWNAWTLEWNTPSPPELKNFKKLEEVSTKRPLDKNSFK
jgi:cytochrome c oxidase subunit I